MGMTTATHIVQELNSILWGPYCLIPLLVGTGIYFTLKLRFVQVRLFCATVRQVFGGIRIFGKKADREGMSSFQALATAIAAQVGTGNLAGVATAIAMGGPGAIFWMWIAAFFGMATIFAEAVLAQLYKTHDRNNHVTGGPAYYITHGLHSRPLACFFSISIIIALGFIGTMVQANSISEAFNTAFHIPAWTCGVFTVGLTGFIIVGGIRRIAYTTEKIVPLLAITYIVGGLTIVFDHWHMIDDAFRMIIIGAFNPEAATGGVIGASIKEAIRYGVARGLFSNEAGMGSTPHAHAVAKVHNPAQQGLAAMFGVFFDTFIVLNMTAFVILTTGVLDGTRTGIALTQQAFAVGLGSNQVGFGFVAVCLFFFAFSTIIGWYFFAEQNVRFLFGPKCLGQFRVLVLCFIMSGTFLHVNLVWELADFFNGMMVFPNLIALIALGKMVSNALKTYETERDTIPLPDQNPDPQ